MNNVFTFKFDSKYMYAKFNFGFITSIGSKKTHFRRFVQNTTR